MGLKLITPPAAGPVSLEEQKLHMRVDHAEEDTLITAQLAAAVSLAESFMSACIVTQVWEWTLDGFSGCLTLPVGPAQSVDAITYLDADGTAQTLDGAAYVVDVTERPARIVPACGHGWPVTRRQLAAVTVRFTAGYGDAATVAARHADIVAAVKLLAAHLYVNREPVNIGNIVNDLPMTVQALLLPHKQWGFG